MQEQVVQVKVDDRFSCALQLDVAEAALRKRSAGGKYGVQQGGERADGVAPRTARRAHDEDLDGTKLAKAYVHVEVAEDPAELRFKERLQLRVPGSGNVDASDVRKGDVAGPIHGERSLLILLTEELNSQFIAGTDDVVRGYGDVIDRRKGGGHVAEERGAEDRQLLPGGLEDKPLKLGDGIRCGRGEAVGFADPIPVIAPSSGAGVVGIRPGGCLILAVGGGARRGDTPCALHGRGGGCSRRGYGSGRDRGGDL